MVQEEEAAQEEEDLVVVAVEVLDVNHRESLQHVSGFDDTHSIRLNAGFYFIKYFKFTNKSEFHLKYVWNVLKLIVFIIRVVTNQSYPTIRM